MKIPLVIRDIESRTDDTEEKAIITRIHEMKEHSLSKSILGTPFHEGFEYLLKNMFPQKHRNALSSINFGIPTILANRLAKKEHTPRPNGLE